MAEKKKKPENLTQTEVEEKEQPVQKEKVSKKESAEQKELAESKDKFLRLAADFDNYKKRTAAEKEALRAIVIADTVQTILPILDNLERAVDSAGDEQSALKDGVVMVLNQAHTAFETLGIESFGQRGDSFDPELHNAVMTCEDDELAEDTIADILQKGYRIGDKIIRHAMVKVVK